MNKPIFVFFLCLLCFATGVNAQSKYGGIWTNIALEKKIFKKWELGLEQELRTDDFLQHLDRWSISGNIEHKIIAPLRVGLNYTLMNVFDKKYEVYQFRNRLQPYLTVKLSWNNFKLSIKEGTQFTKKNDSKRIKKNGKIDQYKINPAWVWKSNLKLEYKIDKIKTAPGYEFESYYELNNPEGNQFKKYRHTFFLKHKINKRNTIKIFHLTDTRYFKRKDTKYTSSQYIIGISYKISLD